MMKRTITLQPGSAGTLGHGSEYVDPGIVTPAYPFSTETFTYDALDRLVGTSVRNTQVTFLMTHKAIS